MASTSAASAAALSAFSAACRRSAVSTRSASARAVVSSAISFKVSCIRFSNAAASAAARAITSNRTALSAAILTRFASASFSSRICCSAFLCFAILRPKCPLINCCIFVEAAAARSRSTLAAAASAAALSAARLFSTAVTVATRISSRAPSVTYPA